MRVAYELCRRLAWVLLGCRSFGGDGILRFGCGDAFRGDPPLVPREGIIEGEGGTGEQVHEQEGRNEHLGFAGDVGVQQVCREHVSQHASEHHDAGHGAIRGFDSQMPFLRGCDSGFHDEINHKEEASRTQGQGHEVCAWSQGGSDQDGDEEHGGEAQQHREDRGGALANEPYHSEQRGCREVHSCAHDEARGQLEDVDHEHGVYERCYKGQHDGGCQHGGKVAQGAAQVGGGLGF